MFPNSLVIRASASLKQVKLVQKASPRELAASGIHWADAAALLVVLVLSVELYFSAAAKSATYDEPFHIARGLSYLRTGDLRLIHEHPPLIDMLVALPLALDHTIVLPLNDPSWEQADKQAFADQLLWRANPDGPSMVSRARIPIIVLTLALAILVYSWARQLYGPASGLLSLTLLAFDPNVIAHGRLATNDIGVTVFVTLTAYTFWRFLHKPSWGRAAVSGVCLGLAEASKFSAIFLIPALVAVYLVEWRLYGSDKCKIGNRGRMLGYLGLIGLAAAFMVWAIYGFQVGPVKGYKLPGQAYLDGLLFLRDKIENSKATFLLGSYSENGWWYYFPVAMAVKTPVPTMLLVTAGLSYGCRRRRRRLALPLLIPCAVYLALCMATPWNIGYRHLLPVLPFFFILTGSLGQISWRSKPGLAAGLLLTWLVAGSLLTFPHYCAYFNELIGGPDGGYRVLGDSNLDWGQDLIGLRQYMDKNRIPSIRLSYLGTAEPRAYGIEYERLPGFPGAGWRDEEPETIGDPGPGVYAISIGNLQGARLKNHDLYHWFRLRKPEAIIGHSIYVYRLPPLE